MPLGTMQCIASVCLAQKNDTSTAGYCNSGVPMTLDESGALWSGLGGIFVGHPNFSRMLFRLVVALPTGPVSASNGQLAQYARLWNRHLAPHS